MLSVRLATMLRLAIVCQGTLEVLYYHVIKLNLIQVRVVYIAIALFFRFSSYTYFIT